MEGKDIYQRGMEEAPENGKELSHSAHTNGMVSEDGRTDTFPPHCLYCTRHIKNACCWYNINT